MKNIEKFFVTISLFLIVMTWLLFAYVFAEQNIAIFSQQAQVYNTSSFSSPTSVLESTIGSSATSGLKSSTSAASTLETAPNANNSTGASANISTNSTSGSSVAVQSTVDVKPAGKFVSPLVGSSISSKIDIKFEIAEATSVEFYIKKIESTTEIYLGASHLVSAGIWGYSWDTSSTPNGSYYIIPYISNKYGRYPGNSIYIINISNQVQQQANATPAPMQSQETKLVQTQNQINNSVSQKTKEISNDVNNAIPQDEAAAVKQELDGLSLKIISNTGISQKQELDQSNQELALKAKEVGDLIANSSGDPAKTEIIQNKIGDLVSVSIDQLNDYFSQKQRVEITYQTPKEVQAPVSDEYQIKDVQLVVSSQNKDEKVLKIQGKAPANSFVTIYIYSSPTIVVTKADANGNWEYTLDKPLTDGRHTVYASVTNNKGDIEKVSKAFDFAKAEDKIISLLSPVGGSTESPAQSLNRVFIVMIAITIFLAIIFVVLVLGIYLKQHNK